MKHEGYMFVCQYTHPLGHDHAWAFLSCAVQSPNELNPVVSGEVNVFAGHFEVTMIAMRKQYT